MTNVMNLLSWRVPETQNVFVYIEKRLRPSLALCTCDLIKKIFFFYFVIRKREHNCRKELEFIIIHDCAVG